MTRWSRDQGGQALILIAVALGGLLLGIGLALDTGQLFVSRRAAQTAADAGAWAGASILYAGGSAAQAQTAALADAALNGYAPGTWTTITAIPPTTGTYANDPGYIEVTITQDVLTRFLFGATAGRTRITTRAVAGVARSGTGQAVIVTRASGSTTFRLQGGTRFTITGGGTNTNTNNANAVQVNGAGVLTATYHRVTGSVQAADAAKMVPAPTTGVAAAADPFATLAGPSTTFLPAFGAQTITTSVILNPGVYSGLVSVNNGGTARLNPGNYVFRAGLRKQGTGSLVLNVAGAGVLLYNANASYPAAGGACGNLALGGSGLLSLSASTTGSYAGMLVFQHRTCANGASITMSSTTVLGGTLYVPAATLTIPLSSNATIASQIVADQLTLSGGPTLTMNFTPASITGTRVPSLVE